LLIDPWNFQSSLYRTNTSVQVVELGVVKGYVPAVVSWKWLGIGGGSRLATTTHCSCKARHEW
jgi:hypothetical protein